MTRINVYRYPTDELDEPKTLEGWFDLDKVTETIKERTRWDGNNNVSVHVGRYEHQILYRTAQGRWVLHTWSQWMGVEQTYVYLSDGDAKSWLIRNESDDVIDTYFGELEEERGPGRPGIGRPVGVRLGELLALVDERADSAAIGRAEMIRQLVEQALTTSSGTINDVHPSVRHRVATTAAATTTQPVRVWWSARPGTIHPGEGGDTWAIADVSVEWPNGATATATLKICVLGVRLRDLGQVSAVDVAVADATAAVITTQTAERIERAAVMANDAWSSGEYDADGGPCVCGEIYPQVRHPRDWDCPSCNAAWAALANR